MVASDHSVVATASSARRGSVNLEVRISIVTRLFCHCV